MRLAIERSSEISGVVLVNPAVATARKDVLALPVLKHVVPAFPGIASDIKKPGVKEHGYTQTPLKAAASMMAGWKALRADLGRVRSPLLYFKSTEDHVVDPLSYKVIMGSVSSTDVTTRMLDNSYHVATLGQRCPDDLQRLGSLHIASYALLVTQPNDEDWRAIVENFGDTPDADRIAAEVDSGTRTAGSADERPDGCPRRCFVDT